MKQTHTAAHARSSAPLFAQLSQQEIKKLRQLPGWMRWLYFELVALSDFRTGHLFAGSDPRVSYAKLAALMASDQAGAGRPHADPSHDQIRRAIDTLEAMGLVKRDAVANEGARGLYLAVEGRKSTVTNSANSARGFARASQVKKPRKIKEIEQIELPISPEVSPGVSEGNFINTPNPQTGAHLSTDGAPRPPEAPNPPGPIVFGPPGEKIGPPEGAETSPQAGTPPKRLRWLDPMAAQRTAEEERYHRLVEHQRNLGIGPPGGADTSPQAGTPPDKAALLAASKAAADRLRKRIKPTNTVLRGEGLPNAGANGPAEGGAEGQGAP